MIPSSHGFWFAHDDDARIDPADLLPLHDPELVGAIATELMPGEVIRWIGQPNPTRAALRGAPLAVVGLLFVAIALGIVVLQATLPGRRPVTPAVVAVFGVVTLIGVGACWASAWAATRGRTTVYAVTNHRALIREPRWPSGCIVRSFAPDRLTAMECRRRYLTSGANLVFEATTAVDQSGVQGLHQRGFLDIDDAPTVERLIRLTLLRTNKAKPAPEPELA